MGNQNTAVKTLFAEETHCFYCGLPFSYWNRPRHHCRDCGASICDEHSHFPPGTAPEKRTCTQAKQEICQQRKYFLGNNLRQNYSAYHQTASTEDDWRDVMNGKFTLARQD